MLGEGTSETAALIYPKKINWPVNCCQERDRESKLSVSATTAAAIWPQQPSRTTPEATEMVCFYLTSVFSRWSHTRQPKLTCGTGRRFCKDGCWLLALLLSEKSHRHTARRRPPAHNNRARPAQSVDAARTIRANTPSFSRHPLTSLTSLPALRGKLLGGPAPKKFKFSCSPKGTPLFGLQSLAHWLRQIALLLLLCCGEGRAPTPANPTENGFDSRSLTW